MRYRRARARGARWPASVHHASNSVAARAVIGLVMTGQARPDIDPRGRTMMLEERARESVRARPLRVTRRAELHDVTARAAIAIRGGLGPVIHLAERDRVILRLHPLMTLVAGVAR